MDAVRHKVKQADYGLGQDDNPLAPTICSPPKRQQLVDFTRSALQCETGQAAAAQERARISLPIGDRGWVAE